MTATRFARSSSKIGKATRASSHVAGAPISIRSAIPLAPGFEDRIREQLANRVGYGAGVIERGTVRFEDVNGPKGGRDTICRIKLVVSGLPSLIVEKRETSAGLAFALAVQAIGTEFRRCKDKHGLRSRTKPSLHRGQH